MTLLLVLLIVITTIIALLSVPIFVAGRVSRKESLEGTVQLMWGGLFGARIFFVGKEVSVHFRFGPWSLKLNQQQKDSTEKKAKRKKNVKAKDKPKSNNIADWDLVKSVLTRAVWQEFVEYLKRLYRSLHLKGKIDGEYGFEDPSLTGMLCGLLVALDLDNPKIALEPNFAETVIRFDSDLSFRVIPVRILWITGGFAFSRAIRVIWWPLIFKRKRKRRLNLNVQGQC
ncbi:MAG: DUF2953 domain-containing protein [Acidobacteriota bacterium]